MPRENPLDRCRLRGRNRRAGVDTRRLQAAGHRHQVPRHMPSGADGSIRFPARQGWSNQAGARFDHPQYRRTGAAIWEVRGGSSSRLAGICADGRLGIAAKAGKIAASDKKFSLLQQFRWVRLCGLAAIEKMAATAKRGGRSPRSGWSRRALGSKRTRLASYATVQAHWVVAHSCALS